MPRIHGPRIQIKASCFDCVHCISESYRVQGDSGYNVYCNHPKFPEKKHISSSSWNTPDWCPYGPPEQQLLLRLVRKRSPEEWDALQVEL